MACINKKQLDREIKDFVEHSLWEQEGADFLALINGKSFEERLKLLEKARGNIKKKQVSGRHSWHKIGIRIGKSWEFEPIHHDPDTGQMWSEKWRKGKLIKRKQFRASVPPTIIERFKWLFYKMGTR